MGRFSRVSHGALLLAWATATQASAALGQQGAANPDRQAPTTCLPALQREPLKLPAEPPNSAAVAVAAAPGDYRHLLRPTPAGWPVRDHWCVWIEPLQAPAGSGQWQREQQWAQAVGLALHQWGSELTLTRVSEPSLAQLRIWRRRPPLQRQANGQLRASHGRALLGLERVLRGDQWQLEPSVDVLLGANQAPLALQATALHELGHGFGLWAHSDAASDAMAAVPGPQPRLELSPRDRATLRWLLRQSGRLSSPTAPAQNPAAPQSPPRAPRANPAPPN